MIVNARRRQFCEEYLIDLNATQAAIRAGYAERYASTNAHKLLQITAIKEKIDELMAERAKRTEITQDRVLKELAIIAFSNAADYAAVIEREAFMEVDGHQVKLLDDDGNPIMYRTVEPVLTDSLTDEQKRALSVIKKGRDGFEVKPYDKVRALELLGKHLGMFQDKVEVTGEINNPMAGLTTEDLKKLIEDG
ncbi:MAG: terminase small subunit [Kiritimatiellae bacterium]|nr:terminase small subunit [Kiritimatiellia bacterium]